MQADSQCQRLYTENLKTSHAFVVQLSNRPFPSHLVEQRTDAAHLSIINPLAFNIAVNEESKKDSHIAGPCQQRQS